jgi:hypothetical protein
MLAIPRGLILFILIMSPLNPSTLKNAPEDQRDRKDENILHIVSNAADQADSLTNAWMHELLHNTKYRADAQKVDALCDQIDNDRKRESHWEESIWTIPNSELLPGEHLRQHVGTFVMVEGTGLTMRQRFPNCKTNTEECNSAASNTETVSYIVQAPLDIKARILVEKLRLAISQYSAISQFAGEPADDVFVTSWNTAWFDARNVYCRRSPGGKYRNLLGEEEVCK